MLHQRRDVCVCVVYACTEEYHVRVVSDVPLRSSRRSARCCTRDECACVSVCAHIHALEYSYFRCSPALFAEERAVLHQRRVCVCVGVCTHTCTGILVFQMFPSVLRRGAGRAAPETSVRVCRCVHTYMHWNTRISDVPRRSSLRNAPCCIRRVRVCCVCVHRHVHGYLYFRCSPAFFAEERAVLHPTCACVLCMRAQTCT